MFLLHWQVYWPRIRTSQRASLAPCTPLPSLWTCPPGSSSQSPPLPPTRTIDLTVMSLSWPTQWSRRSHTPPCTSLTPGQSSPPPGCLQFAPSSLHDAISGWRWRRYCGGRSHWGGHHSPWPAAPPTAGTGSWWHLPPCLSSWPGPGPWPELVHGLPVPGAESFYSERNKADALPLKSIQVVCICCWRLPQGWWGRGADLNEAPPACPHLPGPEMVDPFQRGRGLLQLPDCVYLKVQIRLQNCWPYYIVICYATEWRGASV